ncbi:major facilitator superfamily domain-containing protein [Protomyces lactucae-debilis]|uniref:Major facilitator superfamily domain-containing protein n=1 Tax=Protomyces lactucae-debilis TaxID=2754530 RepID=A0A1Y2EQY5_PROLT|nr:major facilitator superfamily domain-containing protein [Protomyces lactucae-debilis]ORY73704.1 major facilitator superfamily domain-containing protein [Protomyces lactucae-debilis]
MTERPHEQLQQTREEANPSKFDVVWASEDPENPFHWSTGKKAVVACACLLLTLQVAIASVCYAWISDEVAREFDLSSTVSLLGISLFTMGYAIAPLILAPISELYGRKPVLLVTFAIFVVLQLPTALAPNFICIALCRFLAGAASSTGGAMVGGTLADMYTTDTRGSLMEYFTAATLLGSPVGSVFPAYVVAAPNLGWRWVFWIQLIIDGVILLAFFVVLSETRGSVILSRRAFDLRQSTADDADDRYRYQGDVNKESFSAMVRSSLTFPFMFLFCEPIVAFLSLWVAFAWGILYLFLIAVPLVYTQVFGWVDGKRSLPFLAMAVGCTISLAFAPLQNRWYLRASKSQPNHFNPEARLYTSMFGSLSFTIGIFIFGWSAKDVDSHWIGPAIGIVCVTFGIFSIYSAVFSYLSDCYGTWTSSALASQSFLRNIFASSFALFGKQLYQQLGIQWASSLLGFLCLMLSFTPFVLFRYGAQIRAASKFATSNATVSHVQRPQQGKDGGERIWLKG